MMLQSLLRHDRKGIGAVEFALVAPAFIAMIVGVSQMGKLFFANADMKNSVAAGARVASIWTPASPDGVPDDAAILAAVNGRLAASNAGTRATPSVVRGTDANGNRYVEVRMSYTVPLEFIFFEMAPITLTDSRRVFTQVTQANSTTYTTTSGSPGGTTSATSASSAGGTSASSASSAGGTSTSTSATSASSTSTSSTSTSSTSSGDNNGSSGNASSGSNNGSSGHSHGNCNKKC